MAWISLTGACRCRAADPVIWRRSAASRACSVRSPTVTTRPPGTAQASASRARPSWVVSRRETGPGASSPAATASRIAIASAGVASASSRSRASFRIRLPAGVRAAAGHRQGPQGRAQRLDAGLGGVLHPGRARRERRDRARQAQRLAPPAHRHRGGATGGGRLGRGRDRAPPRRRPRGDDPGRAGADQGERADQRPERPQPGPDGPRPLGERLAQDHPGAGRELPRRLDGAVPQRPARDPGRRQGRRPGRRARAPGRDGRAGLELHPPGGPDEARGDAGALQRGLRGAGLGGVDARGQRLGLAGQRVARPGHLAAQVEPDRERRDQAERARHDDEDDQSGAPGATRAVLGVHAWQGFASRGRKSFRPPVPDRRGRR